MRATLAALIAEPAAVPAAAGAATAAATGADVAAPAVAAVAAKAPAPAAAASATLAASSTTLLRSRASQISLKRKGTAMPVTLAPTSSTSEMTTRARRAGWFSGHTYVSRALIILPALSGFFSAPAAAAPVDGFAADALESVLGVGAVDTAFPGTELCTGACGLAGGCRAAHAICNDRTGDCVQPFDLTLKNTPGAASRVLAAQNTLRLGAAFTDGSFVLHLAVHTAACISDRLQKGYVQPSHTLALRGVVVTDLAQGKFDQR